MEEISKAKESITRNRKPTNPMYSDWDTNNSKIFTVVNMAETMERDLLTGNKWFISKSQNQECSRPNNDLELKYRSTGNDHIPETTSDNNYLKPPRMFKKKQVPEMGDVEKSEVVPKKRMDTLKETLEIGFAGLEQMGKKLEESLVINQSQVSGDNDIQVRTSEKVYIDRNVPSNFSNFKNRDSLKRKLISLKKKNKGFQSAKSEKGKHLIGNDNKFQVGMARGNFGKSLKGLYKKENSFKRRLNEIKNQNIKMLNTKNSSSKESNSVSLQFKNFGFLDSMEKKYNFQNFPDSLAKHSSREDSRKNTQKSKPISSFINFKEELDNQQNEDLNEMDDSKASIKCLLMNQYMEECNSDSDDIQNQQILRGLDEQPDFSNTDKVRSAAKDIIMQQSVDPWEAESSANQNLVNVPYYLNFEKDFRDYAQNSKNLLAFKACSLFTKNKLMEHPLLDVLCETMLKRTRSIWEVEVTLTYIPLEPDYNISTRMITFEAVESLPQFLHDVPFKEPLVQCFSVKMIGCLKVIDFPKVSVSLHPSKDHTRKLTRLELPVPFTLNKFISFEKIPEEQMIEYIQNSSEIQSLSLDLDDNLLVRAEDIVELLPNVLVFEESLFCLFIDFGAQVTAALKVEVVGDLQIQVILYSDQDDPLFTQFIEWFTWMFKKEINV
jgi:hypothetical protein